MGENEDLILKVAKGHILKNLLPATALAMGLAGCDVAPTAHAPSTPTRLTSPKALASLIEDAIPDVTRACQSLASTIDADIDARPADTKATRGRYARQFREVLQPYYDEYDGLTPKEQERQKPALAALEKIVTQYEKAVMVKLDNTYLKFHPSQKSRFEAIRK